MTVLTYIYRLMIKYKNAISNNVAIEKTVKKCFISFASLTLLDAFAKAGDLIAAFDGRIFFLLIMVVFEKMDELQCTNLIKKYNLILLWHFTYT
jgi:hypothetical protein